MLLALDTATSTASLAIYNLEHNQILAEETWLARRRQTQDLLPAIQDMMNRVSVSPTQLSALAVTTGPGSFTGVRIAISVVKGMALGQETPPRLLGLPTLSVTAAPWLAAAAACPSLPAVVAFIQAGRGRYNWARFAPEDPLYLPGPADHRAGKLEDFIAYLRTTPGPVWLVGENTRELNQAAPALPDVTLIDDARALRRAGHLAHLAALHLAMGHEQTLDHLQPLYLRQP
jgi:tRNA threonylcarbamoyl adenosine modification protein YeaZ